MKTLRFMFELVPKAGLRAWLVALTVTVFWAASTTVAAVLAKAMIDGVARHDVQSATLAAVGVGLVAMGGAAAGIVGAKVRIRLRERTGYLVDSSLLELVGGAPTLEQHERPENLDRLAVLMTQHGILAAVPDLLVLSCAILTLTVLNVVVLASVHPVLLLLPLVALPTLVAAVFNLRLDQRRSIREASKARLSNELFVLATSPSAIKELRLLDLGGHLIGRHRDLQAAADHELDRGQRSAVLITAAGWSVFAVGYVAAILLVVNMALTGQATAGDVLLTVLVAGQMNAYVIGAVSVLVGLLQSGASIRSYLWILEQSTDSAAPHTSSKTIPTVTKSGLELEDVSFKYPGTARAAVDRVTLRIPAGSTVAVVGENGSGKTTLIKLLCRLYEPDRGRILLDGVPIRSFSPAEWRSCISAAFQDYVHFELLARHVVGIGDLDKIDDKLSVLTALDRAGASNLPDDLPGGLETPLGHSFENGIEASTGQWQMLALGRALMRPWPLLLLLDEPTASLDSDSEHALFARYRAAARRAGELKGAITVLVSHRLLNVATADLIVVMRDGCISEVGTHDELTRYGGTYAELHELQTRRYH